MRAIFISYRRGDAEGQAGRLFADLVKHFGDKAVFMDVATIEPGRDFRKAIDEHVGTCGVLLSLIGKDWLEAKEAGGVRRLDDPSDFVRLETASALKREIPVVPVLVHGASMPRAEQLPEDLRDLAYRNAIELTHARWDSDLSVLIKALSRYVTPPSMPVSEPAAIAPSAPSSSTSASNPKLYVAAAAVIFAIAVSAFFFLRNGKDETTQAAPPATASVDSSMSANALVSKPAEDAVAADPETATKTAPLKVPSKPRSGLVGTWTGGSDCFVVFSKDDGEYVEGNCDAVSGVYHKISGTYVDSKKVRIAIIRIDESGCQALVNGTIRILSSDTVEMGSEGWNGCGATTGANTTRLSRRN